MLMVGCVTPSKVIEKWDESGQMIERITEYDNSTFYSGKRIGLSIGVDPNTRIPQVVLDYGRFEAARVRDNMWYDSDYGLNDVNLFTGEGSANHHIKMGPKELYGPIINLPKKIEKEE